VQAADGKLDWRGCDESRDKREHRTRGGRHETGAPLHRARTRTLMALERCVASSMMRSAAAASTELTMSHTAGHQGGAGVLGASDMSGRYNEQQSKGGVPRACAAGMRGRAATQRAHGPHLHR